MKILFLSSWFPCPPNNGSKLRLFHLLRALAERHHVSVLSFADEPPAREDIRALSEMVEVLGVIPFKSFKPGRASAVLAYAHPSPRSQIDTFSREMSARAQAALAGRRYDALVVSDLRCAEYALRAGAIPSVLDEIQVGIFRDAAAQGGARQKLTWLKMRGYVRRLARHFKAITAASPVELNYLRQIAPGAKNFHLVPNGVDAQKLKPADQPSASKTLIYNGALTFDANLDAMRFFVSEIWPRVKALEPQAKLKITGSHRGVDTSFCAAPDIELTGYVDDIAAQVRQARACVVPLRKGGGTRLKILEALALGTPVVATSKGAEGLGATSGRDILIADDPKIFAQNAALVLADDDLRSRLAFAGRELAEQKYDWRMIGLDFARLIESLA